MRKILLMHFDHQCIVRNKVMDLSKSFKFDLWLNFSQFNSRNKVTGLHCLSFHAACSFPRAALGRPESNTESRQSSFQIDYESLAPQRCA